MTKDDPFIYVSKKDFDILKKFLRRPEIWTQKGSAQITNDLRYLDWTTEPPTQEGWYWVVTKYQEKFSEKTKVVLLYCNSEAKFQYSPDEYEFFPDDKNFTYWLGPLPEPELPKVLE